MTMPWVRSSRWRLGPRSQPVNRPEPAMAGLDGDRRRQRWPCAYVIVPASRQVAAHRGPNVPAVPVRTGTGKELLASRDPPQPACRRDRPFVVVNCAALRRRPADRGASCSATERGAFTGAHTSQIGRFEAGAQRHRVSRRDWRGLPPLELQPRLLRRDSGGTARTPSATHARTDVDGPRGGWRPTATWADEVRPRPLQARTFYYRPQRLSRSRCPPYARRRAPGHPRCWSGTWWRACQGAGQAGSTPCPPTSNARASRPTTGRGQCARGWKNVIPGARSSCRPDPRCRLVRRGVPSLEPVAGRRKTSRLIEIEATSYRQNVLQTKQVGGIEGLRRRGAIFLGLKPSTLRSRMVKLGHCPNPADPRLPRSVTGSESAAVAPRSDLRPIVTTGFLRAAGSGCS